eukprot:341609-Rhodomonas_salina.2
MAHALWPRQSLSLSDRAAAQRWSSGHNQGYAPTPQRRIQIMGDERAHALRQVGGGSANRELGWTTVEKECVSLVNAPTVPYEQPTHAFVLGLSFPTKEPKLGAIASRETV